MPDSAAHDEDALVNFLATHDAPCPVCSYNLRGLPTAACPECAARLHLQVGSENLRVGPWFLACISFALALGFDGVVSILMTTMITLHPPPAPAQFRQALTMLGWFAFLAICGGIGLIGLFRLRRSFMRLPRRRQWHVALALLGVVFGVHAIYGAIVTGIL